MEIDDVSGMIDNLGDNLLPNEDDMQANWGPQNDAHCGG